MSGLWRCDKPFIYPATPQALQECRVLNATLTRKLRDSASGAVRSEYEGVVANVVHLLFRRGPSAIVWLVVSVGIDAIEAVLFVWRTTHVRKEVLIAFEPPVTNGNSSRSIKSVLGLVFSIAASLHPKPCSILFGRIASLAVASLRSAAILFVKTSTAFGVSAFERSTLSQCFITAFAPANPSEKTATGRVLTLPKHRKTGEFLTSQIDFLHPINVSGL